MICIVSFHDDPHADLVEQALREASSVGVIRVDCERAIDELELIITEDSWSIKRASSPELRVNADELKTVWWRRTNTGKVPQLRSNQDEVDWGECFRATIWAIESLRRERFPFGHPDDLIPAENKVLQIETAKSVGFTVPRTCISSSKRVLADFAGQFDSVVIKPLRVAVVVADGEERHLPATQVTARDLITLLDQEPGSLFLVCQERIRKSADIRVLSMPDGTHYAFEIDTSSLPEGQIDWRQDSMRLPHRQIQIPAAVGNCLDRYLFAMGLKSGSSDFALTSAGTWVFLECNPNGQWLWLELKTGVELARKVSTLLLAHHG
jgi:hypothetical protein